MELRNLTPFPMQVWDSFTVDRYTIGTLLVRSKHKLVQQGNIWYLPLDPDQGSLFAADSFYAEVGQSSLRFCSDYIAHKPRTDIILNTQAWAPNGKPSPHWLARVKIAQHEHCLAIFGARHWTRKFGWWLSEPEPCTQVAIRYENAFGGGINLNGPESAPNYLDFEPRNPLGCGLLHKNHPDKHVVAPQIENPNDLIDIGYPYKRPTPMGLGAIGRSWEPRLSLAGTYDDEWLTKHHPYLPKDFNPSHNQDAHPGLILPRLLLGDEQIQLTHLCPEQAQATLQLPKLKLLWLLENSRGDKLYNRLKLDTVLLDIDQGLEQGSVYLSWRTNWPIQANNQRLTVNLLYPEEVFHG